MNFVNPNYTLSKLVNSPFISMKSYDIIYTIVIFCLTENYASLLRVHFIYIFFFFGRGGRSPLLVDLSRASDYKVVRPGRAGSFFNTNILL